MVYLCIFTHIYLIFICFSQVNIPHIDPMEYMHIQLEPSWPVCFHWETTSLLQGEFKSQNLFGKCGDLPGIGILGLAYQSDGVMKCSIFWCHFEIYISGKNEVMYMEQLVYGSLIEYGHDRLVKKNER